MTPEARRWLERATGAAVLRSRPLSGGIAAAVEAVDVRDGSGRLSRLVLKVYLPDPTEPDQPAREARSLRIARRGGLPVPGVVALDAGGAETGEPALLLTRLPGRHRLRPRGDWRPFVTTLLQLLCRVHEVAAAGEGLPAYEPYLAARVRELAGEAPPGGPRVFMHRDFHQANVLWSRGRVTGIVDWVHGCVGPAWADLAHLRWNLFDLVGDEAADFAVAEFARLRPELPPYQPYWDVATAVSIDAGPRRDRFLGRALAKL